MSCGHSTKPKGDWGEAESEDDVTLSMQVNS
jgi:hypothetical protein